MPSVIPHLPSAPQRDATLAHAVEQWFSVHARDLPWRRTITTIDGSARRNPYHALVSELMCQQTQVSRVVERFNAFIERFPSVQDLACAHENDVLSLWSGLGYYRRARLLHAAARHVVDQLDGSFPTETVALRALPGVGRYTAGAIASMALGQRTPVVDGNVVRVLLRLDAVTGPTARTGDKRAEKWAWSRAESLVALARSPGAFNEGLMELGALVCTPSAPKCRQCPLATHCLARGAGIQETIPAPRQGAARKRLYCAAVIIQDHLGRLAVDRRPSGGMWGGLFQAPTLERPDRPPTAPQVRAWLRQLFSAATLPDAPALRPLTRVDSFTHQTTHREVHFDVWRLTSPNAIPVPVKTPQLWTWIEPARLGSLGLSTPQHRILSRADAIPSTPAPRPCRPLPAGLAKNPSRR